MSETENVRIQKKVFNLLLLAELFILLVYHTIHINLRKSMNL